MSSRTDFIESLIEADHIVLAGLKAYDLAVGNIDAQDIATTTRAMVKRGHNEAEIDAFVTARKQSRLEARHKLHRELWLKALNLIVEPDDNQTELAEKD